MNGSHVDVLAGDSFVEVAPPAARPFSKLSQIVVLVPSDRARAWVLRLVEALQRGAAVPVRILRAPWAAYAPPEIPSEALEQRLFRASGADHADWIATDELAGADGVLWSETLLINATERDHRTFPPDLQAAVILSPSFHGVCGAEGLVRPVLSGETPHLGVLLSTPEGTSLLHGARLATPERFVMRQALHLVFARAITLLLGAVEHVLDGRKLPEPSPPPALQAHAGGLGFWWRLSGAGMPRIGRRLSKPFVRYDWWCIGLRPLQRDCGPLELNLDADSFQILDAGHSRFYADPFLLRHEGQTALFFEDYDYASQRALISCLVLGEDGRPGKAAPVLTRPYHLSYPFVFVHDGVAMMIPETSENGTIELYEATRFPDEWRLRAVLMDKVEASDTTLHFDARTQLWWMFSAITEFGSSSHDTVSIFFSDKLEGPWRPHAGNPVKLDPGCSRPAGPLLPWDGRLFRPTQDCTSAYGAGLVWCEITRLTPETFRETPVARRRPRRGFTGLHTYGRAAGFEVVDFKLDRPRFARGERRFAS
jgi:hypothetical protein